MPFIGLPGSPPIFSKLALSYCPPGGGGKSSPYPSSSSPSCPTPSSWKLCGGRFPKYEFALA
eukprot:3110007-Pyramimonas_sp.AAC.1